MPQRIQTTQLFQHFGSARILDCAHAAMLIRRLPSMLGSLLHSEVLCEHLRSGPDCLHPDDWLHDDLQGRPRNDQPLWKPCVLDDSCSLRARFLTPILQESLGILLMLRFTWLLGMLRFPEREEKKHDTSCR